MTTESEAKIARYSKVEKQGDAWNRVIGVRRLKPSEQSKFSGMTADLTGFDEIKSEEDGSIIKVSHRIPLLIAAAVCYISDENGEARIPFPKTRGELDAMVDRLDIEGLTAARIAASRLVDDERVEDPETAAKN